jgi:hypothetical protein
MLKTIDRVLQRVKRDVEAHSLWFAEDEVTRREIAKCDLINPHSESIASLHSSATVTAFL